MTKESDFFEKTFEKSLDAKLYKSSLYEFLKFAWPIIETTPFIDDFYIKVLCDHFQATYDGDIRRLIINIPPRCGKSTIGSVVFPVWLWIKNPSIKISSGSHAKELSLRDTVKSRYLITSLQFQNLFSMQFNFIGDQNQKGFYINDRKGQRFAFSIGGKITGTGGNYIILDDPIDAKDIYSKTIREGTNRWFDESLITRLNNQNEGIIIIIMHRLHEDDLTGHLLRRGGWEHLCLPMRAEKNRKCKTSIFSDERETGQILSSRFSDDTLKNLETILGSFATASQLQQRPVPFGGAIIKEEWLDFYKTIPSPKIFSAWSWDTAVKVGTENDYSVGTLWYKCQDGYYLEILWRKKVEYPELKRVIEFLWHENKTEAIYVEDKSSGQQIVQDLRHGSNLPIIPVLPGKDMPLRKEERLKLISPLFEAHKIFIKENSSWNNILVDELCSFPNAAHDDIVDSITQFLSKIKKASTTPVISVF